MSQAWQTKIRNIFKKLGLVPGDELDEGLELINDKFRVPLDISIASGILTIDPSTITQKESDGAGGTRNAYKKRISPIEGFDISSASSTLNLTETGSQGDTTTDFKNNPGSAPSMTANYYIQMAIELRNDGKLYLIWGNEHSNPAYAKLPHLINLSGRLLCIIKLQDNNTGGQWKFKTPTKEDIEIINDSALRRVDYGKDLIKQLLPNKDIISICTYDTKKDFDGGAWRNDDNYKKGSLYIETGKVFPEVGMMVVYYGTDNVDKCAVIDIADMSIYCTFEGTTGAYYIPFTQFGVGIRTKSIAFKDGLLVACGNNGSYGGISYVNFKTEQMGAWDDAGKYLYPIKLSERNTANSNQIDLDGDGLVNNVCNDIDLVTIDSRQYIVIGTNGGISKIDLETSRIHDITNASYPIVDAVKWNENGDLLYSFRNSGDTNNFILFKKSAYLLCWGDDSSGNYYDMMWEHARTYSATGHSGTLAAHANSFLSAKMKKDIALLGTEDGLVLSKGYDKIGFGQYPNILTTRIEKDRVVTGLSGSNGGRWITGFGSAIDESAGKIVDHKGIDTTGLTKGADVAIQGAADGYFGNCLGYTFDGTANANLTRATFDAANQNTNFAGAFSFFMLFRLTGGLGTFQSLIHKIKYQSYINTSNLIRFFLQDNAGANTICRQYSGALTTGILYLIHLTYDGSLKRTGLKIHINGVRVDDTDLNQATIPDFDSTAYNLTIGSQGGNNTNMILYKSGCCNGVISESAIKEQWRQVQVIKNQSPALADMTIPGNSNYINGVDLDDNGNILVATGDNSNTGKAFKYDPDNLQVVENLDGVNDSYGNAMLSTKFRDISFLQHDLIAVGGRQDAFIYDLKKDYDNRIKDLVEKGMGSLFLNYDEINYGLKYANGTTWETYVGPFYLPHPGRYLVGHMSTVEGYPNSGVGHQFRIMIGEVQQGFQYLKTRNEYETVPLIFLVEYNCTGYNVPVKVEAQRIVGYGRSISGAPNKIFYLKIR